MAFNFLGRIRSIEQWEEFEEFLLREITVIPQRIVTLNSEIKRLGKLLNSFKAADLQLRSGYSKSDTPDANWIVKPRPREEIDVPVIDTLNAYDVGTLKDPIIDAIKFKRERNEWKIKRIRDLIEQYQNEITLLNTTLSSSNRFPKFAVITCGS